MRAAIFEKVGLPLKIENVPDPEPGENEIVVKVHRCGICGSDLHMTDGHGYTVPAGTVLGHEFAGEVTAVGKGGNRFKIGDRIAAMPIIGCGKCRYCLNGTPAYCLNIGFTYGGYADFARVSAVTAVKLPSTLSLADGALAEPLAVALHGMAMARLAPGARVLIQGAGPIGLAALFWARHLGAGRVDMIEGAPRRAEIARAMGADSVVPPQSREPELLTPSVDDAPDVVVECVGRPGLLGQAIDYVRRGGTIVSLGFCFQPDQLVPALAASREVSLLFPQLYTTREFEVSIEALDRGAVEPRLMVTSTVGYDTLPGVFDSLRKAPVECKVLIDPEKIPA